ncbi:MAG: hypothetical protein L3J12_10145 [Spirochaetales bacterium]|nr:hypothetical protein [Spirochaetales bacterium]
MMIIFLVLLAVGAVYLVNSMGQKAVYSRSEVPENFISRENNSSLEILKERYAEGEISFIEYEDIRNALLENDR